MSNKQSLALYRNLICVSIALLLLFTTSVFVIKSVEQESIDSLIDDATILKE